ncbi:hypothetical protein [Oceaniradius stylonematis]|uniref:hypothetical protein n=1 Tax=Oceaniradius stylonematis TaxID=2184161 RepID=UPI0011C3A1C3|nr:hypothetical protein [Oceaniradius stylonematis]
MLTGFILVEGGLAATITKAANGLDLVATLGGGHAVSLAEYLTPNRTVVGFLGPVLVLVAVFAIAGRLGVRLPPWIISYPAAILLVAAAAVFAAQGYFNGGEIGYRRFTVPVILMAAGGWLAAAASRFLSAEPNDSKRFARYLIASGFGVSVMIAFAIGSAVPLVTNMAGILVIPAALLVQGAYFVDRSAAGAFLATSASVMCLVATYMLYTALQDPFVVTRPMDEQTETVELFGKPHRVDPVLATTISDLKRQADAAGWQPGTPLINLTGNSPLTTVLLDGRFVSGSWLLGGFPGSAEFAQKALSFVDPELVRQAWLVVTPVGERPISPEIVKQFGMRFPEDYERVGEAVMEFKAVPVQGIERWTETQVLWKPKPVTDQTGR